MATIFSSSPVVSEMKKVSKKSVRLFTRRSVHVGYEEHFTNYIFRMGSSNFRVPVDSYYEQPMRRHPNTTVIIHENPLINGFPRFNFNKKKKLINCKHNYNYCCYHHGNCKILLGIRRFMNKIN